MIYSLAVLVVITLAAPVFSQGSGKYILDAQHKCHEELPSITKEFLEELKKMKTLPDDPTRDFKQEIDEPVCFMLCMGKKLSAINDKMEFQAEVLKKLTVDVTGGHATADDAHAIVNKCIDTEHDDECEKAYNYAKCKVAELQNFRFDKEFCPDCNHE